MVNLTDAERRILANQERIFMLLDPENRAEHERKEKIYLSWFVAEYENVLDLNFPVSETICKEVRGILTMFSDIEKLSASFKEWIDEHYYEYKGFSREDGYYAEYAWFLLEETDLFRNLKKKVKESDVSNIRRYLDMLDCWKRTILGRDVAEITKDDFLKFVELQKYITVGWGFELFRS